MFGKKQEASEQKLINVTEPEKVSCDICGCLLYKDKAFAVEEFCVGSWFKYFCQTDKPPYDQVYYPSWGNDTPIKYFKTMTHQVTKEGKIIDKETNPTRKD
jgi:hypothetical protein